MKKAILLIITFLLLNFVYAENILLTGNEGEIKQIQVNENTYDIEFVVVGEKRIQININEVPIVLDLPSSKEIKLDNQNITVSLTNVLDKQASLEFEIQETITEEIEEIELTLPTTEQTLPSITTITGNAIKKATDNIKQNILKYLIGAIIVIIVIYFIYVSLEKDAEKQIDKYYRKAEELHKTAQEYHEDGFPNLAEKTLQKAEKYRQKAREAKLNI